MMTQKLREASILINRHLGLEVLEAAVHGSVLRGFNDPNSDIDVCFLLNRPVSDYVNMSATTFFDLPLEEKRKRTSQLSSVMSRELGWQIMVTILDMRSLLRGIMSSSPFALIAYESFAKKNANVKFLFEPIAKQYFKVENLVYRCGEHIRTGLTTYSSLLSTVGMEYKQERTYLGTLWSAHRLLAYLGGDTVHSRSIQELVESNRALWEKTFPEGFNPVTLGVIKARTDRSPFDMPRGIAKEPSELLQVFIEAVLKKATEHLRANPYRQPTVGQETREMIELYRLLLDQEDEKINQIAMRQNSPTSLAA